MPPKRKTLRKEADREVIKARKEDQHTGKRSALLERTALVSTVMNTLDPGLAYDIMARIFRHP